MALSKTMNFRTVTIWTTGLALILTLILPARCVFNGDDVFFVFMLWFLSSFPLVISFIIARTLEPIIVPNLILFLSTIAYGIWYVYVLYGTVTCCYALAALAPFCIGILALPVMFLVWIIALIFNACLSSSGTDIPGSFDTTVISQP